MSSHLIRILSIAVGLLFCAAQVSAQPTGYKVTSLKGSFEDVFFELSDAVVNKGLVIDFTGHVGSMLSRTSGAVGAKSPYKNAKYIQFCSAKLTSAAVTADPANMAICPFVMFVYETVADPGTIHVGYRRPIGSTTDKSRVALAKIETLLAEILQMVAK